MKKRKIAVFIIVLFLAISIVSPLSIWAQGGGEERPSGYVPLAPLPFTTDSGEGGLSTDLATYIAGMFQLLIGIAGVLAVIVIMVGGIQYMTTDAISGKEEGRERITKALIGLFLAIGSWLILNTINPDLLDTSLEVPIPEQEIEEDLYYVRSVKLGKYGIPGFRECDGSNTKWDKFPASGPFNTREECCNVLERRAGRELGQGCQYATGMSQCLIHSCQRARGVDQ